MIGTFDKRAIRADSHATDAYNNMRENCQYSRIEDGGETGNGSLIVTLLNARSLRRHAIDISYDQVLMESDIIGFTETHILSNERSNDTIEEILQPFHIIQNNLGSNRYANIAFA